MTIKKIALCLRGHMRSYQKIFPQLKINLLDKFNVIIFIHTWNLNSVDGQNIDINHIETLYKPAQIIVENQSTCYNTPWFINNKNRDKFKFQMYGIAMVNKMVTQYENLHNMKFDIQIITRPDFTIINNIENLLQNTNFVVTLPKYQYYDLCFFGSREIIDQLGNIINVKKKNIPKKYKSYGLNPLIRCCIKIAKCNHITFDIGWIVR